MNINIAEDCSVATLETPISSYIENIENGLSTACCHNLIIEANCCQDTRVTLPIRTLYDFQYSITDCGLELVSDVLFQYLDITFTGIDFNCLTEVRYTDQRDGNELIITDITDLTFRSYLGSAASNPISYTFLFTTNCGLQYQVSFEISITDPLDFCNTIVPSQVSVVYPDLPEGVTIVNNQMILTPEVIGQLDSFSSAVYFFSLTENNIPDSESVFIDCEVQCLVLDFISKNPCSNLYMLYEALVNSNLCNNIDYCNKASLWEYIGRHLGFFKEGICLSNISDCGCN